VKYLLNVAVWLINHALDLAETIPSTLSVASACLASDAAEHKVGDLEDVQLDQLTSL